MTLCITGKNKDFVKTFKDAYGRFPKVGALYGYIAGQLLIKGFDKAGKMDTEKFIDAIEGMKVDSPVGEVEMRACDHQAVLPMFLGRTTRSADYPFLVATDIMMIPGPEAVPSCEVIKKARR